MLYNISFDICAGVITLIALYTMIFRRDPERFSNRILLIVIGMHFVSIVFDIWSSVCNSYTADHSRLLRDFTNYIFLGVHTSEAAVFFWFLTVQLGVSQKMKRWQHFIIWLPELLMIMIPLLLNPVFGTVFVYDDLDFYVHGPEMFLLYAGADLYMILCIALVIRRRERMTRQQTRAALALLLLSTVPMLVQSILIPHQLIEMFFQALGFYGYMLAVENVDESRNPVTHAWNRHALIRDLAYRMASGAKMCAVIVKLSQIEVLRIASEGSSGFHSFRLRLAEWFEQMTKPANMRFYDCERGVYVILITGTEADEAGRKFCCSAESRFEGPWRCGDLETHIPVQLSEVGEDCSDISVQEFLYMISQPYVHTEEGVVYADSSLLLSAFRGENSEIEKLPRDLQDSLDSFLDGMAQLTPAELRICDLYIAGYKIGEIPEKAFISMNTVKKHNKNIYRKLGVGSREELLLYVDLFYRCGKEDELIRRKH